MRKRALLRTPKAADLLGISPATLAKWRVVGGGPPYFKLGRAVVYDLIELRKWAEERSRASTRSEVAMGRKIEMDLEGFAKSMAKARERERERCARVLDAAADTALGLGRPNQASTLREQAEALRAITNAGIVMELPSLADAPPETVVEEMGLPPVRHMDDFAEGVALVQGGMWKNGLTGRFRDGGS